MTITIQNFINNEFVPTSTESTINSYNPSTGEINALIPDSGKADIELAVKAAEIAAKSWAKTSAGVRSNYMNKIADIMEQRLEEFAEAESADQGKPVALARIMDIPRAVANFRYFAGAILHHEDSSSLVDGAVSYSVSQPVGIAGLISPWNLPIYLLTWKIAPAIACGNTCICKPSEVTSMTAWLLCKVIAEAGLPAGVVNMVFGNGPNAGNELCIHPKVRLISFTGGTKTGEIITRNTAPFQKKLSLELGGKNPNIIFADCDLEDCVTTTVRSSFTNQGEVCLCGSRIFVEQSIYDEFLTKFVAASKKLVVGDPKDPNTTTGAIVSKEHMEKILYYIQLAKDEGGKCELGGDQPNFAGTHLEKGYFVNPTIITGLHPVTSRCQQEEIFGPVVTVCPFTTEEEVIELANSVCYGLSSSLWTKDIKRAQRVALQVEAGTVWINCWLLRDLRMPFGGVKASGVGREGGRYSMEFYTEQKTVCIKYA